MIHTILWRRLDAPGHELARLHESADGRRRLDGAAVFLDEDGRPCRIEYEVVCDERWRTSRAVAHGLIGHRAVRAEVTADADGRWRLNGIDVPAVTGCVDVDLSITPATNSLPIRRLSLGVGQRANVRAAWLRFPQLTLEPLDQVYGRVDATTYAYESDGGTFRARLHVNAEGWVTSYESLWIAEAFTAFQNA